MALFASATSASLPTAVALDCYPSASNCCVALLLSSHQQRVTLARVHGVVRCAEERCASSSVSRLPIFSFALHHRSRSVQHDSTSWTSPPSRCTQQNRRSLRPITAAALKSLLCASYLNSSETVPDPISSDPLCNEPRHIPRSCLKYSRPHSNYISLRRPAGFLQVAVSKAPTSSATTHQCVATGAPDTAQRLIVRYLTPESSLSFALQSIKLFAFPKVLGPSTRVL